MTDYRDVQDEYRRPDRQRTYPTTGEGGNNTLYWLIGIAALIVVGGLFLLSAQPNGSGVATDQPAMTTPADPAGTQAPAVGGGTEPAAPATPAPAQ